MARFTKILKDKAMRRLVNDKKVHRQAYRLSKARFEAKKRKMLSDFENHPVTREIEGGPNASNISGTIIGEGNLFSFIGFDNMYNPIDPVLNLLRQGTTLSNVKPRMQKAKDRIYLGFRVNIPSNGELAAVSKMPWEPGSWLFKIERGLSGLGYYIYEKYIKVSRSGTGIQSDGKVRQAMYRRTKYMSAILSTFRRGLNK